MAVTGLALVGFLIEHLSGNFTLFQADEKFDHYKEFLEGFGPLLRVAEVGLFLVFAIHILVAFRVNLENREARKERYIVRSSRGASTAASVSMLVTGSLILLFLIKHWTDFRFDAGYHADPAATVKRTLGSPFSGTVYALAMGVLGLHLAHGFRSAFQSLGISHTKLVPLLEVAGLVVAVALAVGFASIPVYMLFFWSGDAS